MKIRNYERLSTVYDHDWGKWPTKYVSMIQEMLLERDIPHANILDLACGTGTLALELAKIGHLVVGLDISPEMIEIAKSKASDNLNVSFYVRDMLDLAYHDQFDCVTCTFDSINYLRDIDQLRRLFERVMIALRPGGMFLFDSNTDQLYLHRHKGTHPREIGGQSFLQILQYDPEQRIATTVFQFSDGTEEVHMQRPFNLEEISSIFGKLGSRVVRTISGFDGKPYTVESDRLICLAEKQNVEADA